MARIYRAKKTAAQATTAVQHSGKQHRVEYHFPVHFEVPNPADPAGSKVKYVSIFVPHATGTFLDLPPAPAKAGYTTYTMHVHQGAKGASSKVAVSVRGVPSYSAKGQRTATLILAKKATIGNKERITLRLPVATGMQIPDILDFLSSRAAGKVAMIHLGGKYIPVPSTAAASGTTHS